MKKWLLVLAVMLITTLSAGALGPKLGLTGGYNLSWTKVNSAAFLNLVNGGSGAGWFIGPKVDLDLTLGLHLDGSLVYNQRKFTVAQEGKADFSQNYNSLDIPVNAKYRFTIGGVGVYASTGPQFSFSLGEKSISVSNWDIQDGKTPLFKRSNLSTTWNFGAGVVLAKNFELGLGYNMAVGKSGKTFLNKVGVAVGGTNLPAYRLNTFNLQASYYF